MPLLLLFSGPASATRRVRGGVQLSVVVDRQVSGVRLSVATARERVRRPVYLSVRTLDPLTLLPPPVPGQSGGGSGEAYVVTHTGLPVEATDYTISGSIDGGTAQRLPRLSATLLGRVPLSGQLHIGVRVGPYAQSYGPFAAVGQTYERTPTGWVTKVNSLDTSEADADPDSPLMPEFGDEFLPWEVERDLTPYEQAVKQRDEAVQRQREARIQRDTERRLNEKLDSGTLTPSERAAVRAQLKAVRKAKTVPPDRRHVPVQAVIDLALRTLPLPFHLAAPLPFGGDFFWASESTGVVKDGGVVKGVSFQLKGKTPVQVLEELLGPVGWQVVIRFGEVYIGPPAELEVAGQTPGTLQLPGDLLTGLSQELVNPDVSGAGGNARLPRKATVQGATLIRHLPSLPPDPDDQQAQRDDFVAKKDAELRETGTDTSPHPLTRRPRLDGSWVSVKTKRDGLLRQETYRREGIVPNPDGQHVQKIQTTGEFVNTTYTFVTERWELTEDRVTTYFYEDPIYPDAETRQVSRKREWKGGIPFLIPEGASFTGPEKASAVVLSEETETVSEWSPQGWLLRKTTHTTTYQDFKWPFGLDAPISRPTVEVIAEEWTPINKDTWQLTRLRRSEGWEAQTDEDGGVSDPLPVLKTSREVAITDQGPPRAPDPDDGSDTEGEDEQDAQTFTYEEPLEFVVYPGGRGEAVTRSIPWATSIDPKWAEWVIASIRRARPAQRTRYGMAAPPALELGTRVREFSISGRGGGVDASVTIEEALDV
ncbi:hypothetical protein [Deinococcus wulumuqiensis]|uniref:hypothetical protein n=1 Tax=Deinococcus wulumuqiensis TaxID=980427 RepID=UPI00243230D7|nr:hypothetical protein [Deinococcus wulumuqiensis]